MPLERARLDDLTEADIQELVADQVPEGLRLEYKRQSYGASESDKKEALKDMSAFANSHGGHLVLGVEERDGVAVAVPGLAGTDADGEIARLEQLARTGIEPRITNIQTRAIQLSSGNFIIIMRIPKSWNPPHRVSAQRSNRFWLRNSAGAHEASVDELRQLFSLSTSAAQAIRQFREERVSLIQSGKGSSPVEGPGRMILHIVPLSAFGGGEHIDLRRAYDLHTMFQPIGSMGLTPRFNLDGVLLCTGGERCVAYTQVFRTGILEAVKGNLVREHDGRRVMAGVSFEKNLFSVLVAYVEGLRRLGVPPPLVLMLSLEGMQNVMYAVKGSYPFQEFDPAMDRDIILLPEGVLDEYTEAPAVHRAIRPALDALWNATGYPQAQWFDQTGIWGEPRR